MKEGIMMQEEVLTQVASQMTVPLWLALTILGLLVTVVLAFIPYIIFQVKQMFMVTESMKVLLIHVQDTQKSNNENEKYQIKMETKTENYTATLAMIVSNNQTILTLQKQSKEASVNQTKLISNNTEAMTNIRIALASNMNKHRK